MRPGNWVAFFTEKVITLSPSLERLPEPHPQPGGGRQVRVPRQRGEQEELDQQPTPAKRR
jgi:hypothetical protein